MKKKITAEFDYSDDGYFIRKNSGTLTLQEIQRIINKEIGEGAYFIFMNTECSYYDENDIWTEVDPTGDSVKVFSYDVIRRMFSGTEGTK